MRPAYSTEKESAMFRKLRGIRKNLGFKLILTVGVTLLLSFSIWAYYNIEHQKKQIMDHILAGVDKVGHTTLLGAHYAMMTNSRDDINQIITNISKQKEIENIRIYNKEGQIKFSNRPSEVDRTTNIKDEACYICHRTDPPMTELQLRDRTRIFDSSKGYRLLGIISPIYNEPGCSSGGCHVHPPDKKVLGALDFVVSLKDVDEETLRLEKEFIFWALFIFAVASATILLFLFEFVNQPIRKLIKWTHKIAKGEYDGAIDIPHKDEIGDLAVAISQMGKEINEKQAELNKQRDEYQQLFEQVPCFITVQDKNYKLLRYNREFSEKFEPRPGDYCYFAYKGRTEKCPDCPVEKTFEDGRSHISEEFGRNKDGTVTHWIVQTSPIRNASGEITAVMELNLDITPRKTLEEELEKSEKKYYAIFNNIPNPVFVLDADTLRILDCNGSVTPVYGYAKGDIINASFLDLFPEENRDHFAEKMKSMKFLSKIKNIHKDGKTLYVNVRMSLSEYPGQRVLLVTTSDITKRLETEEQLSQASKMATLGEMATGIAHELNQPLTVMKTASSFLLKKVDDAREIDRDVLHKMSAKINKNVDRATKIINHMREFARKSEMMLEPVRINAVLENAFEIFSQQLRVRGIEVVWETAEGLPLVMADAGRLEQVFINLIINARDAIEDKWASGEQSRGEDRITLRTGEQNNHVIAEVIDTGVGISEDIKDKMFEPFYTTKEVGKGTGLGLSISYGIIKDYHGEIQVISRKGGGACFRVILPAAEHD